MKIKLALLFIIVGTITGCKLDDAGFTQNATPSATTGVTSGSILGTWFLKSQRTVGTPLGGAVDNTVIGTVKDYYLFKADKTVQFSSINDGISTGTYTYNPSTKSLTIILSKETDVFIVNTLTTDALVLYNTTSEPAFNTSLNTTLTFKR